MPKESARTMLCHWQPLLSEYLRISRTDPGPPAPKAPTLLAQASVTHHLPQSLSSRVTSHGPCSTNQVCFEGPPSVSVEGTGAQEERFVWRTYGRHGGTIDAGVSAMPLVAARSGTPAYKS